MSKLKSTGGIQYFWAPFLLLNSATKYKQFDYLILISGQDFPLKSSEEIIQFLTVNKGKEYLEYFELPYERWNNGGFERFNYYWLVDELGLTSSSHFVNTQKAENVSREFPNSLKPYGGSMWFTITNECASYICMYLSDNLNVLDFFKDTAHSDELIIPTIVLNSTFKANVENNNLRYIDWSDNKPNPKTLTTKDLEMLSISDSHFARKFDLLIDSGIVDELEKRVVNATAIAK